jgi:hypothetical protein
MQPGRNLTDIGKVLGGALRVPFSAIKAAVSSAGGGGAGQDESKRRMGDEAAAAGAAAATGVDSGNRWAAQRSAGWSQDGGDARPPRSSIVQAAQESQASEAAGNSDAEEEGDAWPRSFASLTAAPKPSPARPLRSQYSIAVPEGDDVRGSSAEED